jgi:hypothetical protein
VLIATWSRLSLDKAEGAILNVPPFTQSPGGYNDMYFGRGTVCGRIWLKPGCYHTGTESKDILKNESINDNKQHQRRLLRINSVNWGIEYSVGGAGNCFMTAL